MGGHKWLAEKKFLSASPNVAQDPRKKKFFFLSSGFSVLFRPILSF